MGTPRQRGLPVTVIAFPSPWPDRPPCAHVCARNGPSIL